MINTDQINDVIGATAYGQDGDKIGTIGQVFVDQNTGEPEFATVNTGFFGTNESFIPLQRATFQDDRLTVPYSKDQVKDAPNVDVEDQHLDESEEQRLYSHYGLTAASAAGHGSAGPDAGTADTATTDSGLDADARGHDLSGPTTDDAMTRSEEKLRVGTTSEETGRAHLRKYVTTEQETHTIPVRKERAVIEREPITEGNVGSAMEGPEISDEEHEMTLHEERPVVEKTTEPVERVRLAKEVDTSQEQVTEEVRKEHIESDTGEGPTERP